MQNHFVTMKVLIVFAHPRFEKSFNQLLLVKQIPVSGEITFHDLYERYPGFDVDLEAEQRLLTEHDVIVWQHPFYWYSAPALLKQWIDIVLDFGWAYGPGGTSLQGKYAMNVITAGGPRQAYSKGGYNRFAVRDLLAPFDQTAVLCHMTYLPPFVLHGTHRLTRDEGMAAASDYRFLLETLRSGDFPAEDMVKHVYMNDWIALQKH
jgi:glutathione-regulated potassium-efflux system ancillary protein KefG